MTYQVFLFHNGRRVGFIYPTTICNEQSGIFRADEQYMRNNETVIKRSCPDFSMEESLRRIDQYTWEVIRGKSELKCRRSAHDDIRELMKNPLALAKHMSRRH